MKPTAPRNIWIMLRLVSGQPLGMEVVPLVDSVVTGPVQSSHVESIALCIAQEIQW